MQFEHYNAETINGAVSLLSKHMGRAKIIAGGVDLIGLMKNKVITPSVVINIKTIPGLAYIREDDEGLELGSLTTINEIEKSSIIKDKYGLLAEAAHSVASPHIRNMATIVGNLCQDVMCWYYRRSPVTGLSFSCYRKSGKSCYALTGDNMYHAIIGGRKCFAVCPSDLATALIALGSRIKIVGPIGERTVMLEDFYHPLGNILKPNEIITAIHVPTPRCGTKQRYLKFRLRKSIDFTVSGVAIALTREDGCVSNARIVLGGVAPIPFRAVRAEEIIEGKVITESLAEKSAKSAVSEARPLSKNAYKVTLTEALVKRALLE